MRNNRSSWAIVALLLGMAFFASGCPKLEVTARDTIAGAKAITDNVKAKYSCPAETAQCKKWSDAVAVKDSAINALEVYCSGPQFDTGGGACTPAADPTAQKNAAIKLNAIITQLKQIEADLKPLLGGKP